MRIIPLLILMTLNSILISEPVTLDIWESDPVNKNRVTTRIELNLGVNYALFHSGIYSTSKVWIDGVLYREYGGVQQDYIPFIPQDSETIITIEYYNEHYPWSKMSNWMFIDRLEIIEREYIKGQTVTFVILGILSICSILFLLLSFVNLKIRYNLYMGFFTLFSLLTILLTNKTIIFLLFHSVNGELIEQLSRVTLTLSFTTIILFIMYLFRSTYNRKSYTVVTIFGVVLALLSLLPIKTWYDYKIYIPYTLHIFLSGLFIIYKILFKVKRDTDLRTTFLISTTVYWISVLFDTLLSSNYNLLYPLHNLLLIPLVISMFLLIAKERLKSSKLNQEKEEVNSGIRDNFSQYVPLEILDSIGNSRLEDREPGDHSLRAATIIEIDIRNFTGMSELMTPKESFSLINMFYRIVGDEVEKSDGFIESYGGDGIKAIFTNSPGDAVEAAKRISLEVKNRMDIKIGMAIHFGKVIMGTVGYSAKIQATTISDVTRLLHKIDLFESKMELEMIITAITYNLSKLNEDDVLKLGSITLKDEKESVELYELRTEDNRWDPMFKDAFESAISMIESKQYTHARTYFDLALLYNPGHKLSEYYIKELDLFKNSEYVLFELMIK